MDDLTQNMKNTEYKPLEGMCFKLRDIEYMKNKTQEWSLRLQFIESHLILIAASGQGWLNIDGRFNELRQGSAYLCAPGQLVEAFVHSFDERGFYHLKFDIIRDEASLNPNEQAVRQHNSFPVKGEVVVLSPVSINELCETIAKCWQHEDYLKRFRSQILFQEMLHTILQDSLLVQETDSEAALDSTKNYIEQHYQQELTIEQLAKVAGMSSRHFMRLFKKRYGFSAIDYLAIYRIEQAQQLMRMNGHYRLRDIARHVGYHDDIYFRRKFKQITGTPPAAFMKNSRQKIAAYHFPSIGQLIALQVTPCAAPAAHPWTDYYRRKYETDSVLPLSTGHETKLKELRLLHPDFIIGIDSLTSPEEKAELQKIAPAYFVPWVGNDWRTHLRLLAQFLNKTAAAEIWLAHYERKARFVREQIEHNVQSDRLLILRITGEHYNVLGSHSLGTVFYDDLHIVPAHGVDLMKPDQQVMPTDLNRFEANRLLIIVDQDAQSQSSWHTLMNAEPWRNLNAVRDGRVDFLPSYLWVEYTAFTHDLMLDEALKLWRDRT